MIFAEELISMSGIDPSPWDFSKIFLSDRRSLPLVHHPELYIWVKIKTNGWGSTVLSVDTHLRKRKGKDGKAGFTTAVLDIAAKSEVRRRK